MTACNTYRGLMPALAGTPWQAKTMHASVNELCQLGCIAVIDFADIRHAITVIGMGESVRLREPLMPKPLPLTKENLMERYGGVAIILRKR